MSYIPKKVVQKGLNKTQNFLTSLNGLGLKGIDDAFCIVGKQRKSSLVGLG